MASNREQVRASQLRYLWQVVLWLVLSGLAAPFLFKLASAATGGQRQVMGVVGILIMLAIVGGSFVIHRRDVRCPACNAWLVPVGINGIAPSSCPSCKVDLRT